MNNDEDPTKPLQIEPPKAIEKLNERQELFCQLYSSDREFFGNGVQTYIEVYQPKQNRPNWYKTACSDASQLLSNTKVEKRINDLLELRGLNDGFVDKQLEFLITQHMDFRTKLGAIREYNQLKSRIVSKTESNLTGEFTIILARYPDPNGLKLNGQ
jgi:hypothetical protein